jgi:3-oxoacyl-[acyl-carrier-protein] synthase-3
MAFLSVPNVAIKGIAACVPLNSVENTDQKVIAYTGIERRRVTIQNASDLCYEAGKILLADLGWKEVDFLIFVTQTPDYKIPATACKLQDRLGLSKETAAFDISLGCSGWVYGLSIIASLKGRGLLLVGDTLSQISGDQTTIPIFGDAGTATAVENKEGENMYFHLASDGFRWDAIHQFDGFMKMDGMAVYSFVMREVAKSIQMLILKYKFCEIDYLILHQSNKAMIETVTI